MTTITVLLIITAFFIALIITVFQYFFKSKNEGKVKYWLSLLRFLSVFLILIVFINPSINKASYQLVKPKLFVAIDNSQSIKFNKNDSIVKSLVKQVENSKQLNSKFDISYYSFGNKVRALDSLTFSENNTNLVLPLKVFSEITPVTHSPIILFSDGNQTTGTLDYTNIKNNVFPVIVGDTTTFEDLKISTVNVNTTTNIDNNFPVEIFINYEGKLSITKKLAIYNSKKKVFSKEINLSRTNNSKNLLIYLKAEQKGNQYFKATIESIKKEKNKLNNTAYFSTRVIDNPTKIAIVSSINHPDIGTLKNAIENKKQFKVSLINNLYKNIKINDYQLFILYQPDLKFNTIFKQIKNFNKNYFIISGLHTDWNYLNKVQSYFIKSDLQKSEKFECFLNDDYSKFNIKNIDFTNFSPLLSNFGDLNFNQPYQTLLFKKINGIKTKQPLLATLSDGNRKIALLSGEGIWRWRMQSFAKNKTFINFDNFIASLIQYLSGERRKNSIKVTAKPIYHTNENIEISAIYFNENFEVDTRNKIWLTIFTGQHEQIKRVPFTVNQNQYKVSVSDLKPGIYNYLISDKNQHVYYKNKFKITNFNIEEQFQNSNSKNLTVLAKNTSGKLIYPNDFKSLITSLVNNGKYQVVQNKIKINESLINYKWILFLIALFLSTEWFVRKYIGKM